MAKHAPPQRKRRTDEHRRADVAVKVVQLAIARAGYTSSVGEPGSDYGFDVQVKAHARPTELADGSGITYPLDRRDLAHWLGETSPVILVIYDAGADVAYWTYVQRYFAHQPGFSLQAAGDRVTIRLDKRDVFDPVAAREVGRLKRLCQWQAAGKVRHG